MALTKMAKAWKTAAKDLAVEFVAPFTCRDDSGLEFVCSGWLPHFGGPKGALILSRDDVVPPEIDDIYLFVWGLGYWASGLSPFYYEKYNRRIFIETLTDWGWYGQLEDKPFWCFGRGPCDGTVICEFCHHLAHTVDPAICSKQIPCEACRFYNTVPYWTNPAWQRQKRLKRRLSP